MDHPEFINKDVMKSRNTVVNAAVIYVSSNMRNTRATTQSPALPPVEQRPAHEANFNINYDPQPDTIPQVSTSNEQKTENMGDMLMRARQNLESFYEESDLV